LCWRSRCVRGCASMSPVFARWRRAFRAVRESCNVRSMRLSTLLVLLGVTRLACGPALPTDPNSPNEPASAAETLGGESADIVVGMLDPWVVDMEAHHRGQLEIWMRDRVVVVAYTPEGLAFLPDCRIDGHYRFMGMTAKTDLTRLSDATE